MMNQVTKMTFEPNHANKESGIWIGGDKAYVQEWPLNPEGDPLIHLFSIDCNQLAKHIHTATLPADTLISVFSTYSATDYFLDQVTYTGDELEWNENIVGGCTLVSVTTSPYMSHSPGACIPSCGVAFSEVELDEQEFPAFSFLTSSPPNGIHGITHLLDQYGIVCQIYSGDFPAPYQDILGLTDANGYLFLRNDIEASEVPLAGIFFVQTA
ncbi:DUF1963 domain-containing protein [Paenibacillus xylanexedens]|uniref:DUF1963 domain-containing protein n=1 Tax=Paenibacillus xylanexedens TaxID=528191 RepID=UPI001C9311AB|nr:DUF1963 domain-containing protein [Paenibacillus xylanexedens]